jgi:hypothetical protein
MTAEVVIMNTVGVAMAADSAVTIGNNASKIFTSTDKLFQLSTADPVAIMTFQNAALLGVPWETIVKQYRDAQGRREFTTVEEHAKSFLRFISRNRSMFPVPVQNDGIVHILGRSFLQFRDSWLKPALDAHSKDKDLKATDIAQIARVVLKGAREVLRTQSQRLPGFGAERAARIAARYRPQARRILKEVFGTLPLDDATKGGLVQYALDRLSRSAFTNGFTGVVFAGFGSRQHLPSLVAYQIEGFAGGRLRAGPPQHSRIEQLGSTASIIPFAQKEAVEAFMEGVDRDLKERFGKEVRTAITQVGESLVNAIKKKNPKLSAEMKKVLEQGVPRVMEALDKNWDKLSESHWRPITEIVHTLPKDELAAMAESLVNLTKFKRRITPKKETVGGPIDVAVITRGDGFVWIKRKHYFDPNLNPRAMSKFRA